MSNKFKTSDLIRKELENDLYLLEVLKDGLINYTALSKKLLPVIKKENSKATLESISIAIKRYILDENTKPYQKITKNIIYNSQLRTRNDIIHMTFRRNDLILDKILEISKKITCDLDEIFFINQGFAEITIIFDKKNKYYFNEFKYNLIEETTDLAILSIKEIFEDKLDKSIEIAGIYSYFINQLSRKSINIVEIMSTFSQLTFILKNKDLMRAYNIIEYSINYFRNQV